MTSGDRPASKRFRPLAEVAREIRNELKRRFGWTRYHVSVRTFDHGPDEAVRSRVKAAGVPLRRVLRVARQFEHIRRCEYSGDILEGGNRVVSVSLDREVLAPFLRPLRQRLEALPVLGWNEGHELRFGHYAFLVYRRESAGPSSFYFAGGDYAFDSLGAAAQIAHTLAQSRQWRKLLAELTA